MSRPSSSEDVRRALALLDTLLALERPFRADAVGSALGIELAPTQRSTVYFTMFESTAPEGAVDLVEVREPTPRAHPDREGMVLVTLRPLQVTRADVAHRTGPSDGRPHIPPPGAPPDLPRYAAYPQPWGTLRLGVDPANGYINRIILDAC